MYSFSWAKLHFIVLIRRLSTLFLLGELIMKEVNGVKETFEHFPLYEFSGSYKEIGRQYGEAMREEFRYMVDWWYGNLSDLIPGKSIEDLKAATQVFEQPSKDYAPDQYAMMEGMSEGSGLSMKDLFYLTGCFELDAAFPAYLACTSYAASGKATKDGKTILGQNYDWYHGSIPVVLRIKPDHGPAFLSVTLAGHLPQVGINEYGIGQFVNILLTATAGPGVPYNVLVAKVLTQKNVPDMIRTITQAPRAIAFNHMLAGKDGEIIDVETAPYSCGLVLPHDDILAHANHYECHYLKKDDFADQTSFPDTFLRAYRLQQLMEEKRGELCPEVMKQLLTDHRGYPDCICRHLDTTGPIGEQFETSMSMIAVPEDGYILATNNPCTNGDYKKYTL